MRQNQIASSYAQALLELCQKETGTLEEVEKELIQLKQILMDDPSVREFVLSPLLKKEEKEEVLLKALEGNASEIVVSFIGVLNRKNRMEYLSTICEFYSEGVDRILGRIHAVVESREPLSEENYGKIKKILEEKFHTQVILQNQVKPNLIGGFVIRMNDYLIDASMQSKLEEIRKLLLSKKINVGAFYEN